MDTTEQPRPAATAGDVAIRRTTAAVVVGVAVLAAYVSYRHALHLAIGHGEPVSTAVAAALTVDGLIFAASMVMLHAARHRLPKPALAYGLLALAIAATLAANVASGWAHGPIGALVAAWPAVALVGSYEMFMWLIRTGPALPAATESMPEVADLAAVVQAAADAGMSQRAIADKFEINRHRVKQLLSQAATAPAIESQPEPA